MGHASVEDAVIALGEGRAVLVELPDRAVVVALAGTAGTADVRRLGEDTLALAGGNGAGTDVAGVLRDPDDRAVAADLLRLVAGRDPAAAAPGVVAGTLAGRPRHVPLPAVTARVAADHGLTLIGLDDLVHHRWRHEELVVDVAVASLPLPEAAWRAHAFRSAVTGTEHLALVLGDVAGAADVLCRVHSECVTGDVLGSLRCDCGLQLAEARARIAAAGAGILLYLRGHEGRGIGLAEKLRAYALQEQGHDTYDANVLLGHPPDGRDFGDAAQMLRSLGPASVRLLTNNPAKLARLEALGIAVTDRVPLEVAANDHNRAYLDAKRRRFGHLLDAGGDRPG